MATAEEACLTHRPLVPAGKPLVHQSVAPRLGPDAPIPSRRGRLPEELVASVSPPTALSLTWGLDDYVALLSEAVTSAS
jgi:hypothetical protein